ncbi:MAG: hypothetical protein N2235_14640 [Fischerella sp.]|nr:hypothetical protein [Fischerella sp.]
MLENFSYHHYPTVRRPSGIYTPSPLNTIFLYHELRVLRRLQTIATRSRNSSGYQNEIDS